jgi:hypothetical protein
MLYPKYHQECSILHHHPKSFFTGQAFLAYILLDTGWAEKVPEGKKFFKKK